jgi:hypothetical protein
MSEWGFGSFSSETISEKREARSEKREATVTTIASFRLALVFEWRVKVAFTVSSSDGQEAVLDVDVKRLGS